MRLKRPHERARCVRGREVESPGTGQSMPSARRFTPSILALAHQNTHQRVVYAAARPAQGGSRGYAQGVGDLATQSRVVSEGALTSPRNAKPRTRRGRCPGKPGKDIPLAMGLDRNPRCAVQFHASLAGDADHVKAPQPTKRFHNRSLPCRWSPRRSLGAIPFRWAGAPLRRRARGDFMRGDPLAVGMQKDRPRLAHRITRAR